MPKPEVVPAPEPEVMPAAPAPPPSPQEPEIVTLETLEEGEPQAKRRRKNKLIIDKNHQLTNEFLRSRIENINVDLRCEDSSDEIVNLFVPANILLHRPVHAGTRFQNNVARPLTRLFSRNLGVIAARPLPEREMELTLANRARRAKVPRILKAIPEEPRPVERQELEMPEPQQPIDETILNQSTTVPDILATAVDVEKDIADMLTQKLVTTPRKRTSPEDLNTSEQLQAQPPAEPVGSESPETMLGSLDRTEVSLVDSEENTETKRFIRDQWGSEGTMVRILNMLKAEVRPINMNSLMSFGPVVPGNTRIIAARCFTSILKLKQNGFIKVRKDPDTSEIVDIYLGPKFESS